MKVLFNFLLSSIFFRSLAYGFAIWCQAVVIYGQDFSKPNPRAEAWVEKQISQNFKANLYDAFSDEEAVLGSTFLEKILDADGESNPRRPRLIQIRHAVIAGNVDLRNVEFKQGISLTDCKFEGSVLFSQSHFPYAVILDDSSFLKEVSFSAIRADNSVFLRRTMFQKSFDLSGALIQGDLSITKARFLDTERGNDFSAVEISGNSYWSQTVFEGPVRCHDLTLSGQLLANDSHFLDAKTGVLFPRLRAVGLASFDGASFDGPVEWSGAEIRGQFQASAAHFNNTQYPVSFTEMQVDENLILTKASFGGPVQFCGIDVRGSIDLNDASFVNPKARVDFSRADMRNAFFANCRFQGLLQLANMNYQNLYAGDRNGEYTHLLNLIESAQYSLDAYLGLEDYFLKRGELQAADRIFIARKQRERRELLPLYSFAWFVNGFLEQACGYGRKPERLLQIALGVILFAALFIFRPSRMEPVDPYGKPFRNSFWYSLELFLPLVDLRTVQYFIPRPKSRWIRGYQRLHILLGWLLVSLFLASILGWIQ